MISLSILLIALGLPVLGSATYLFVLAVAAKQPKLDHSAPSIEKAPAVRFDIVVPAHNEEGGIASTVQSLLAIDYPAELRRILVVADNCTDRTAELAGQAGATVLNRTDATLRGKGYALAYAFERIEKDALADAIVVIDADTLVSSNLLRAFADRFQAGAACVQADYSVRNPTESWRTRLMVIAFALFHVLRSLARERFGLSAGLRGNGMGFSRAVLRDVPYTAYSLVEDVEYGIKLGEAGHRVHYVHEAQVRGEMVASEGASRSQRKRWEEGRAHFARTIGLRLFSKGLLKRDPLLFDLAMDLIVPPLATLTLASVIGAVISFAAVWMYGLPGWVLAPWLLSLSFIFIYVLRGWSLSGTGLRGIIDLCCAPLYVIWKISLRLRGGGSKKSEWVRTARSK